MIKPLKLLNIALFSIVGILVIANLFLMLCFVVPRLYENVRYYKLNPLNLYEIHSYKMYLANGGYHEYDDVRRLSDGRWQYKDCWIDGLPMNDPPTILYYSSKNFRTGYETNPLNESECYLKGGNWTWGYLTPGVTLG
jgi:hypothetical protein